MPRRFAGVVIKRRGFYLGVKGSYDIRKEGGIGIYWRF